MKSYLFFPLFFLVVLGTPASSFTQEEFPNTSDPLIPTEQYEAEGIPQEEIPSSWTQEHVTHEADTFQAKFINMLVILALLIGFMILASWSLKRLMKSKMVNLNTASNIKLIETRHLSPRATLYLVEVEGKNFLIAESPTAVTHLGSFPIEGPK